MHLRVIFAIAILGRLAHGWDYDYKFGGLDWPSLEPPRGSSSVNQCGEASNQSPINLFEPLGPYGWAYGFPLPFETDQFSMHYVNEPSTMVWEGKRLQTYFSDHSREVSFLTSSLGQDIYGAPGAKASPKGFHFHMPSEHFIDGQEFEVEFHLSHKFTSRESSPIKKVDLSIFFSIDAYDRSVSNEEMITIDSFFEGMNLQGLDLAFQELGIETLLPLTSVMQMIDFDDRWIYKGSSTAPPCTKLVYRGLMRRIYPIQQKHYYIMQSIFEQNKASMGGVPTNSRALNGINGHDIYYVGARQLGLSPFILIALVAVI